MGRVINFQKSYNNIIKPDPQIRTNKGNNRKTTPLPRIIALLVAVYVLFAFGNQFIKLNQMNEEVEKIKGQIESLEVKNRQIKSEIRKLQSNTYIERMAREKLGLVKPGETVILPAKSGEAKPLKKNGKLYD